MAQESKAKRRAKRKETLNQESVAIEKVEDALEDLRPDQKVAVIDYVRSRVGPLPATYPDGSPAGPGDPPPAPDDGDE